MPRSLDAIRVQSTGESERVSMRSAHTTVFLFSLADWKKKGGTCFDREKRERKCVCVCVCASHPFCLSDTHILRHEYIYIDRPSVTIIFVFLREEGRGGAGWKSLVGRRRRRRRRDNLDHTERKQEREKEA